MGKAWAAGVMNAAFNPHTQHAFAYSTLPFYSIIQLFATICKDNPQSLTSVGDYFVPLQSVIN